MGKITKAEYLSLKKQNLTDAEVARKHGITRQAVHQIAKQYCIPSKRQLYNFANVINFGESGLLSFARSLKASERNIIGSQLAAVSIYYGIIQKMSCHLLKALHNHLAQSVHHTSNGQITVTFNGPWSQLAENISIFAHFEFPNQKELDALLKNVLQRLGRIGDLMCRVEKSELLGLINEDLECFYAESEKLIEKQKNLLDFLNKMFGEEKALSHE